MLELASIESVSRVGSLLCYVSEYYFRGGLALGVLLVYPSRCIFKNLVLMPSLLYEHSGTFESRSVGSR